MLHYFIAYSWRRLGKPAVTIENKVLDQHPLDWLIERSKSETEEYRLLWYVIITESQYEDLRDHLR